MKKVVQFGIILSLSLIGTNVYAACSDKELNDWAENVKITYKEEIKTESYNPEFKYVLLVSPYNEKVNVKVKFDNNVYDIDYDEYYKTNAIGSYIHFDDKKYSIEFYGNDKSSCNGELLREIEYITPGYNKYKDYEYCEANPDNDICKSDTKTSNITDEEFSNKTKTIEKDNSILSIIKEYWYFVVIPVLIVCCIYYYKVYLLKKKESRK